MTVVSTMPTPWATLETALHARRPIWVTYHAKRRLICPHALGWKNQRAMVLGYQTGGDTTSGTLDPDPRKRWRLLFVDQIDHIDQPDSTARWATADNYNATHPFAAIDEVFTAIGANTSDNSR